MLGPVDEVIREVERAFPDLTIIVRGNRVVALELRHDADLAAHVDVGLDDALGGHAAGLLLGGSDALLAEPLHRLVHVAVGLGQRLLALHHANAGRLAQLLNLCSSDCHFLILLFWIKGRLFPAPLGRLNYSAASCAAGASAGAASSLCSPW